MQINRRNFKFKNQPPVVFCEKAAVKNFDTCLFACH